MAQNGQGNESSQPAVAVTPAFAGIPTRNNDAALFVGGLSFSASEDDLRQDRETGKPRGFAFVNFETPECVDTAIRECQGMELCGRNVRLDRSAAGMVGRGKGKGGSHHYMPYHPSGDFGMYSGNFRGNIYPPSMMSHFAPMYPAVPYGFAAPPPANGAGASSSSASGEDQVDGQKVGGPPPPPPPPPQFMFHPMVGHPYHPMMGMTPYPSHSPAPPAPPAPPSANAE